MGGRRSRSRLLILQACPGPVIHSHSILLARGFPEQAFAKDDPLRASMLLAPGPCCHLQLSDRSSPSRISMVEVSLILLAS